jgi:hypothetical protein
MTISPESTQALRELADVLLRDPKSLRYPEGAALIIDRPLTEEARASLGS